MFEFTESGRVQVEGRGTVITIENPHYPDLPDPDALKGQQVKIDGVLYEVLGVETYAIPRSVEAPYTRPFGLLVESVLPITPPLEANGLVESSQSEG